MAGETKPYRFLLRMSDELRRRLADSAERSGKSLNREIVERLEASLSEHVVAEREATSAMPSRPRRPSQIGGMMTRRRRHALAAFAVALVAAIAAIAGMALTGSSANEAVAGDPEFPPALSQHLRSIPGNGGEPSEGPGSYEEQQFVALAYPAADIPQAALAGARSAAAGKKGKFGTGKGQKGQWISVGPTEALYPATELRSSFSYVPNAYVAGGRTTVLAIAPTCKPGQCRLWAGAAGGGIWTTKNALNGQPSWDFVSGSFGIQSVSSITVDPNDPSGDTAWVGTGEANASGDSAAGVGVYKTTNGGATWTGPLGGSVFNSRAVGSIAVVPGSPNTIYAASTRGVRGVSSVSGGGVSIIPGAPKWGLYKSTDGGASWTFIHNGAATTAGCTGDTTEATNGTPCSPRGVRRVVLDPQNPSIVYAGSYARGVWKSTNAGVDVDADSHPARQQRRGHDLAARDRGQRQERQDGHVHRRRCLGRTGGTGLPHGRRAGGDTRVVDPDEFEPSRPALRNVQLLHRPVLVRQLRRHTEGLARTSSTSAARTRTARPGTSPTAALSCSRGTADRPGTT